MPDTPLDSGAPPGGDALDDPSDRLLPPVWTPVSRLWMMFMLINVIGTALLLALVGWSVWTGTGLWGNNIPVAWGFPIINFVWWIGIGHAGTFISAILLLLEQKWRAPINRFAEAMTLFAVLQAALFPLLHMGRPWFAYWLAPYPSTMDVWPQFRSALPWDAMAIATYFSVSLMLWYTGLLPDLAAIRDRAPTIRRRRIYGVLALGWSGSTSGWRRFRVAYGLLAGVATPLVISVHSIVSSDFAMTLIPGWHSTIFPPYFVAGAILSGFAMVITLLIPVRAKLGLHQVITDDHLDKLGKMILVTGWIVLYSYIIETFAAWYSGHEAEVYQMLVARPFGHYGWITWLTLICNCVVIQVFWVRWARRNVWVLWIVSILVNVGMWCERFVIVEVSLMRHYLVSKWEVYVPTWIDVGILVGTVCFFLVLMLLFIRFVPVASVFEIREQAHEEAAEARHHQREVGHAG